jgi:hypothetical protein
VCGHLDDPPASKLPEYGSQASKFGTVITFEDIAAAYPHATKAT